MVGGTSPGRPAAHGPVGGHLPLGLVGPILGHWPILPAVLVDAAHVEGSGHGHAGPQVCQPLSELQSCLANVDGAVDVGGGDVHERRCAIDLCHLDHDGHGHLRRRSQAAIEHAPVRSGQGQHGCHLGGACCVLYVIGWLHSFGYASVRRPPHHWKSWPAFRVPIIAQQPRFYPTAAQRRREHSPTLRSSFASFCGAPGETLGRDDSWVWDSRNLRGNALAGWTRDVYPTISGQ